ncbi:MAG: ribonuclease E/G, partial [Litorivicinus sp.]
MRGELLINVTPQETRVAVIENGMLQELHTERSRTRGLVGQIYMGRVLRVLPGMQAAFVDIGLERSAFIHERNLRGDSSVPISSRLHEGQALRVQVEKDPIGDKGARLTAQISLPARYLVFMPDADHVGVSARIEDETERERLRERVQALGEGMGGFVVRTAADGVSDDELEQDIK